MQRMRERRVLVEEEASGLGDQTQLQARVQRTQVRRTFHWEPLENLQRKLTRTRKNYFVPIFGLWYRMVLIVSKMHFNYENSYSIENDYNRSNCIGRALCGESQHFLY